MSPRLASLVALVVAIAPARADTIVTAAARIENCKVQTIRAGTIFYETAEKAIATVPVGDISSISFDGLHELDDAERSLSRDEADAAIDKLLVAFSKVEDESKRTWLHARLALAHGRMGDTVEAAGHLGAVLSVDAAPVWLTLAPEGDANETSFNAAAEAMHFIDTARRRARDEAVTAALEEMRTMIAPLFDRLQAEAGERRYRPGSTISGILLRDLGEPRPPRVSGAEPGAGEGGGAADPAGAGAPRLDPASFEAGSAESIDALIEAARFDEAIDACEAASDEPGDRDLARFLHQRGRALAGAGRGREAAVEFMRCAVHFPGTRFAALSLIEAGLYYRDSLVRPQTARRLLEAAATMAEEMNDADLAARARGLVPT